MKNILLFILISASSIFSTELGLGVRGIDLSTFEKNNFSLYLSGTVQYRYKDGNFINPFSLDINCGWYKIEKNKLIMHLMSGFYISQNFGRSRYGSEYDLNAYGINVIALSVMIDISEKTGVFLYNNIFNIDVDFSDLSQTEYRLGFWSGSFNFGLYFRY